MPHVHLNGVDIYYEDTGSGFPVVFCHEFAGDHRSWAPQVEAMAGQFRCITFSYRGYPPSDVPDDLDAYGQDVLVADVLGLLNHLEIEEAHIVGLSMGGNVTLQFALEHPERCRSIVVAACGAGSTNRDLFEQENDKIVELLRAGDMQNFADVYGRGPGRLPFLNKDPEGWKRFRAELAEHSATGSANTQLRVQRLRPVVFTLEDQLRELDVPTLVICGDEDEPCIETSVFMKRTIPRCGLLMVPQSGHTINLEEPAVFNQALLDFWAKVERGAWMSREHITTSLLPPA
jgi:pimeloyl-ACP methyl ester carboxylesterase